jgi:hypothetical protein
MEWMVELILKTISHGNETNFYVSIQPKNTNPPKKLNRKGLATIGNLVHAPYPRTHDMNKRYRSK